MSRTFQLTKNRKAQGNLQLIANNFFYIMMLIFAVVILMNSVNSMEMTYNYRLTNMKFNNYAARAMYSDNCFAYEATYESSLGTRTRVYPATIDLDKLSADRLNNCLNGLDERDDFEIAVAILDDEVISLEAENTGADGEGTTGSAVEDEEDAETNDEAVEAEVDKETCTSLGYVCIGADLTCSGPQEFDYDDSCEENQICCNGVGQKVEIKVGEIVYSSKKTDEAYDYDKACAAKITTQSTWFGLGEKKKKVEWGRVATFFVDIRDGEITKRGILKFCFEESKSKE